MAHIWVPTEWDKATDGLLRRSCVVSGRPGYFKGRAELMRVEQACELLGVSIERLEAICGRRDWPWVEFWADDYRMEGAKVFRALRLLWRRRLRLAWSGTNEKRRP